ncbi:hypothetical protein [Actinoallomurus purpureus]|nr:hypothetical protein [Actinoallomurus purpureus]
MSSNEPSTSGEDRTLEASYNVGGNLVEIFTEEIPDEDEQPS